MPRPRLRRQDLLAAVACLLFVPACSRQPQDPEGGATISGKVTFQGQPVAYGLVLFYDMEAGLNPEKGTVVPAGMGKINAGRYEAPHVPPGRMMVCVATDPEIPLHELVGPRSLGGLPDPQSFDPMMGGRPPGLKDGGAKGAPPPRGGSPLTGQLGDPKKGPPPKTDVAPAPPATRVIGLHPDAQNLSPEQIQSLKTIHTKYGEVGRSPLVFEVKENVDETYDIRLK